MLHKMVFHSSGKVVAFHLDNSTEETYLCKEGGRVSLSKLACSILNLTDKYSSTLSPAYIPDHVNVEANIIYHWEGWFHNGILFFI